MCRELLWTICDMTVMARARHGTLIGDLPQHAVASVGLSFTVSYLEVHYIIALLLYSYSSKVGRVPRRALQVVLYHVYYLTLHVHTLLYQTSRPGRGGRLAVHDGSHEKAGRELSNVARHV